ncbi:TnsD family Tn7-like transposition protein [Paenibacillus sp. IHB B 3084]|uniref:TnsD family Tn7-like transposition protein n=1 Tax=Paenibacillus sp. IHB B 3084 TaxID=867076 RepID=UPI002FF56C9A
MTGVTASSVDRSSDLKFCPICYEEDIMRHGESYWHRTLQATGVMICPNHGVVLHRIVHLVADRHGLTVLPIARWLFQSEPVLVDLPEKTLLRLQEIALDVQLLLGMKQSHELYDLRESLLYKLSEQGWLTPAKRIRQRELAEQFTIYYGKELLEMLGCMTYGNDYSWLTLATRKARRAVHPLRQLLLIRFLFGSFKLFLEQRNIRYFPFGEGPWPCLSKAADHYKESTIERVQITRCTDTGKPVGTFTCRCGFSYSRRGPDQTLQDRLQIGRIKAFGPVWMNQLKVHLQNGLSYRATAEKLGVDTNTVIKYALHDQVEQGLDYGKTQAGLKSKKAKLSGMKSATGYIRVDWETRDLEISWEVEAASKRLLEDNQSKPIRITVASIGKRIGKLALLEKHKDRLPLTTAILTNYLESVDQFQIRRVQWAAKQMKDEFPIKRWKLIRKAGLRPGYSQTVSETLDYYSGQGLHTLSITDEVTSQWHQ